MSIGEKKRVKCPACQAEQEIMVWESVTATDADVKEDILKGRVNVLTCGECGIKARLAVPLVYTDAEKKLVIYYVDARDSAAKYEKFASVKEETKHSGELAELAGYSLRFVADYNELLEKILIFDAGLFDKAVEVVKLAVLMQDEARADKRTAVFGKIEDDFLEFMVTDSEEGMIYTSKVPRATYDTIETALRQSGVKHTSFDWEIVDSDHAKTLLYGANNIL